MAGLIASTARAMGCLSYKRGQMGSCTCVEEVKQVEANEQIMKTDSESSKVAGVSKETDAVQTPENDAKVPTPDINDATVLEEEEEDDDDNNDATVDEEDEPEEEEEEEQEDLNSFKEQDDMYSGPKSEDIWARARKNYRDSLHRMKDLDDIEIPMPPLSDTDDEIEEMLMQDDEFRKYIEEFQNDDMLASVIRGDEDTMKILDDILPPGL